MSGSLAYIASVLWSRGASEEVRVVLPERPSDDARDLAIMRALFNDGLLVQGDSVVSWRVEGSDESGEFNADVRVRPFFFRSDDYRPAPTFLGTESQTAGERWRGLIQGRGQW